MTEIFEVEGEAGRSLAKILRRDFLHLPQIVDRMRLEADILSAIDNSHVVRLLDHDRTPEGRPYLVLERLTGHTLRGELVRRGALPVAEAVNLTLQALEGIAAAHHLGVVHRDLKPDNLFLSRTKRDGPALKILDFGFATIVKAPGVRGRIKPLVISTAEKEFVGVARFAAPEQFAVGGKVDHRADIYTLGLILYTLALGREPHHDVDSRRELQRAHVEGRLETPSPDTVERISNELLGIIWRATSTSQDDRYESADAFADNLRGFLKSSQPAGEGISKRTFTVQQHAEMTASIEVDPDRARDIRARYGIVSAGQARAVDGWWKENIGSSPKAHSKWRALVDLYKKRLRAGPRDSS